MFKRSFKIIYIHCYEAFSPRKKFVVKINVTISNVRLIAKFNWIVDVTGNLYYPT